jgi:hypothetical protein
MVKGKWIEFRKAFSRFEIFSPCFKCFFLWLNKTPPKRDTPLSVQEGFWYILFKILLSPSFEHNRITIDKYSLKTLSFWNRWWCGPFALGSYFLPLWHESPKTESLEPVEVLSSPLVMSKWVKIVPKTKSGPFTLGFYSLPKDKVLFLERWRRMSYGVEAFVFAEDSNFLSIHLWLGLK